jgi:hypothetical protein
MDKPNATETTFSPQRHIYACEYSALWVVATSADEAAKIYGETEGDSAAGRTFVQVPDDEEFPMCFEDDVPRGLERDCQCALEFIDDEDYCQNCGDRNTVTLPAGEWANMKGPGAPEIVFYEFMA